MDATNRIVLMPQYMKTFSCIGSLCKDSCCCGWSIAIDQRTYKKYKLLTDRQLSAKLMKNIERNTAIGANDKNYASITLAKYDWCPFITENKLCSIQLLHGHELLGDICRSYPRKTNIVNGVHELSGNISCPEIARLALLDPNIIEFDEVEEPKSNNTVISTVLNTNRDKKDIYNYFWEIRMMSVDILQNRKYSVEVRLIILGLFIENCAEIEQKKQYNAIIELVEYTKKIIDSEILKEQLNELHANYEVQAAMLSEMVKTVFKLYKNKQSYVERLKPLAEGLGIDENTSKDALINNYRRAYESYYKPYMAEREYIIENYLVNYVFMNLFPFTCGTKLFDSFTLLTLNFSLLKMYLIGYSAYYKQLDEQKTIDIISFFARIVEHSSTYQQLLMKYMHNNKYDNMEMMTILIRS